ncbi:MAG: hypothetical protein KAS38_04745, partial [Anaerolineales bacterium]|nr:hypothetical protein [Anaerolineales bacterium]
KQVDKASWEDLSPDELEERRSFEDRKYREIMDNWKRKHLTGWRQEHDRANRLIVTRAVCNEVAEHIQHLRGHTAPGGLTAKPEWYLRNEKNPKMARAQDIPYLVKPSSVEHFNAGASILWLRWVHSQPNAWRIAHPITLKNGEGLLPGGTAKRYTAQPRKVISKAKATATGQPSNWVMERKGSAYQRNRTTFVQRQSSDRRKASKNKKVKSKTKGTKVRMNQRQWLRWIHEATVAEVAETADGHVVLTFETALPYEDRRRSTIGIFKHTVSELKYGMTGTSFNGTFVGYVPEGELPYPDLKEMLDWDKILPKSSLPQDKIQNYWKKVAPLEPLTGDISFSFEIQPEPETFTGSPVEVRPRFSYLWHKESILCYTLEPGEKNVLVYQPKVALGRGLQLSVDKANPVLIDQHNYYRVISCDLEPRAEGLYVRESDILELPEGKVSKPVEAKGQLNLRKISPWNLIGKPIMQLAQVELSEGTTFRVSTVHKVTSSDTGDGVIDAAGSLDYYLIVDCPKKSSAVGLFVPTQQVNQLSEEEFIQRNSIAMSELVAPQNLPVEVLSEG